MTTVKTKKSRFLWLLLAASLALNVFFVGGALYYRMMAGELRRDPQARIEYMVDRLGLDATGAEKLRQTRDALIALRQESEEERRDKRQALWAMMVAPDFDRDALRALLVERQDARIERRLKMAETLHGYLAGLTPEQRAAFVDMAQERSFFRRFLGRGERGH